MKPIIGKEYPSFTIDHHMREMGLAENVQDFFQLLAVCRLDQKVCMTCHLPDIMVGKLLLYQHLPFHCPAQFFK